MIVMNRVHWHRGVLTSGRASEGERWEGTAPCIRDAARAAIEVALRGDVGWALVLRNGWCQLGVARLVLDPWARVGRPEAVVIEAVASVAHALEVFARLLEVEGVSGGEGEVQAGRPVCRSPGLYVVGSRWAAGRIQRATGSDAVTVVARAAQLRTKYSAPEPPWSSRGSLVGAEAVDLV